MSRQQMTKAEQAVVSMVRRIARDPRVAYLVGPMSQTYEDLTEAYAEILERNVDEFRKEFEAQLKYEEWPERKTE